MWFLFFLNRNGAAAIVEVGYAISLWSGRPIAGNDRASLPALARSGLRRNLYTIEDIMVQQERLE